MFSRIRPILKTHGFQNVYRGCATQTAFEAFLKTVKDTPPKPEYSLLFFDDQVQKLLKKISNIEIEKIFKPKPRGKSLSTPVYKLMTNEELQREMQKFNETAETLMQIPPLVNLAEDKIEILDPDTSLDGHDDHHAKHVFVDVSHNKTNENRIIIVREPDGVLRTAGRFERFRANQVFNPTPGREMKTPEMFDFENLKDVLKRKEYEFVLDRACVQFEPDQIEYHEVITLAYEAINHCSDFPMLYSTRHFGSLAFYLITHQKIGNLLNYNILNDRIDDAFTLIKLYHIIHPNCKSAEKSKGKTDMETLENFIEFDSKDKDSLSRSLDIYKRREEAQKETAEGIRKAHGI